MTIRYRIIPDLQFSYIKGFGIVYADEIMLEGARMFAESEWCNGFNILIDYREITKMRVTAEDVGKIVDQDEANKHLFDRSRCAIVAESDLVFGLSRMWKALSKNDHIKTMVFRDIRDSLKWLGLDESIFQSIYEPA